MLYSTSQGLDVNYLQVPLVAQKSYDIQFINHFNNNETQDLQFSQQLINKKSTDILIMIHSAEQFTINVRNIQSEFLI